MKFDINSRSIEVLIVNGRKRERRREMFIEIQGMNRVRLPREYNGEINYQGKLSLKGDI